MNKKSGKHSRGIRFTALVVAFVFTATSITWNTPASALPTDVAAPVFSSIDTLAIPAEMGTISKTYRGERETASIGRSPLDVSQNDKTVILIQDAHAVIDAQENIAKILGHFGKEYGIRLAALEGAKGRLEPILLRTFPDNFVKTRVMEGYKKRAELSGPEMAAVFGDETGEFQGMEDWPIYEKNYFAYLGAQEKKDGLLAQWNTTKQALDRERLKVYDEKLGEFHGYWEGYKSERTSLIDLLMYLAGFPKLCTKEDGYKELPDLIASVGYEKAGRQEALTPLVRQIADQFKTKYLRGLGVKTEMNFYNRYQGFQTGQISAGQMLQYLVQLGAEIGKRPKLTPALRRLLGHAETLSQIKGSALYEELERFLPEVANSLIKNKVQREMAEKYQRLFLVKNLIELDLNQDELVKYQAEPDAYGALFQDASFVNDLAPALEFYKWAEERDRAFSKKIDSMMKENHQKTAVAVAGGFHTNGLERILKEKGVAYAVVTPKIASLAGIDNYAKVMKGEVSFKEYLKTTYFDGLMRHAAKMLTEALPLAERVRTLKLWRDNVIRDLAKQGRIAEAGKYLPYIDEQLKVNGEVASVVPKRSKEEMLGIVKKELEKFKKESFAKIWKTFEFQLSVFTDGLKQLISKRELNTQAVSDLLSRSASAKPSMLAPCASMGLFPEIGILKLVADNMPDLTGITGKLTTPEQILEAVKPYAMPKENTPESALITNTAADLVQHGFNSEDILKAGEVGQVPDAALKEPVANMLDELARLTPNQTRAAVAARLAVEMDGMIKAKRDVSSAPDIPGASIKRSELRDEGAVAQGEQFVVENAKDLVETGKLSIVEIVKQVQTLHESTFPNIPFRYEDSEADIRNGNATVVRENDRIVGYAIHTSSDIAQAGYLNWLAVDKDFQKKGIATQLMDAAGQWFRDKSMKSVTIIPIQGSGSFYNQYFGVEDFTYIKSNGVVSDKKGTVFMTNWRSSASTKVSKQGADQASSQVKDMADAGFEAPQGLPPAPPEYDVLGLNPDGQTIPNESLGPTSEGLFTMEEIRQISLDTAIENLGFGKGKKGEYLQENLDAYLRDGGDSNVGIDIQHRTHSEALKSQMDKIVTITDQKNLLAHGVAERKGGLFNLPGIIMAGGLRDGANAGSLSAGQAIDFGPYFILGASNEEGDWRKWEAFKTILVPENCDRDYLLRALDDLVRQGRLSLSRRSAAEKLIKTYSEFIVENDANSTVRAEVHETRRLESLGEKGITAGEDIKKRVKNAIGNRESFTDPMAEVIVNPSSGIAIEDHDGILDEVKNVRLKIAYHANDTNMVEALNSSRLMGKPSLFDDSRTYAFQDADDGIHKELYRAIAGGEFAGELRKNGLFERVYKFQGRDGTEKKFTQFVAGVLADDADPEQGGNFGISHAPGALVPDIMAHLGRLWTTIHDENTDLETKKLALAEYEWWFFQANPYARAGASLGDAMSMKAQIALGIQIRDEYVHQDLVALSSTLENYKANRVKEFRMQNAPRSEAREAARSRVRDSSEPVAKKSLLFRRIRRIATGVATAATLYLGNWMAVAYVSAPVRSEHKFSSSAYEVQVMTYTEFLERTQKGEDIRYVSTTGMVGYDPKTKGAVPLGFSRVAGTEYGTLNTNERGKNAQATVVVLRSADGKFSLVPTEEFRASNFPSDVYPDAFQIGPVVVTNGVIREETVQFIPGAGKLTEVLGWDASGNVFRIDLWGSDIFGREPPSAKVLRQRLEKWKGQNGIVSAVAVDSGMSALMQIGPWSNLPRVVRDWFRPQFTLVVAVPKKASDAQAKSSVPRSEGREVLIPGESRSEVRVEAMPTIQAKSGPVPLESLNAILQADELDGDLLFKWLEDNFKDRLVFIEGNAGLYAEVREHTKHVMDIFEKATKGRAIPKGVSKSAFRLALLLHDIGKSLSKELSHKDQFTKNLDIIAKDIAPLLLDKGIVSKKDIFLTAVLASGDPLGTFIKGASANADFLTEARDEFKMMWLMSGMAKEEFLDALVLFYKVDAGSYDSIRKDILSDPEGPGLNFKSEVSQKYEDFKRLVSVQSDARSEHVSVATTDEKKNQLLVDWDPSNIEKYDVLEYLNAMKRSSRRFLIHEIDPNLAGKVADTGYLVSGIAAQIRFDARDTMKRPHGATWEIHFSENKVNGYGYDASRDMAPGSVYAILYAVEAILENRLFDLNSVGKSEFNVRGPEDAFDRRAELPVNLGVFFLPSSDPNFDVVKNAAEKNGLKVHVYHGPLEAELNRLLGEDGVVPVSNTVVSSEIVSVRTPDSFGEVVANGRAGEVLMPNCENISDEGIMAQRLAKQGLDLFFMRYTTGANLEKGRENVLKAFEIAPHSAFVIYSLLMTEPEESFLKTLTLHIEELRRIASSQSLEEKYLTDVNLWIAKYDAALGDFGSAESYIFNDPEIINDPQQAKERLYARYPWYFETAFNAGAFERVDKFLGLVYDKILERAGERDSSGNLRTAYKDLMKSDPRFFATDRSKESEALYKELWQIYKDAGKGVTNDTIRRCLALLKVAPSGYVEYVGRESWAKVQVLNDGDLIIKKLRDRILSHFGGVREAVTAARDANTCFGNDLIKALEDMRKNNADLNAFAALYRDWPGSQYTRKDERLLKDDTSLEGFIHEIWSMSDAIQGIDKNPEDFAARKEILGQLKGILASVSSDSALAHGMKMRKVRAFYRKYRSLESDLATSFWDKRINHLFTRAGLIRRSLYRSSGSFEKIVMKALGVAEFSDVVSEEKLAAYEVDGRHLECQQFYSDYFELIDNDADLISRVRHGETGSAVVLADLMKSVSSLAGNKNLPVIDGLFKMFEGKDFTARVSDSENQFFVSTSIPWNGDIYLSSRAQNPQMMIFAEMLYCVLNNDSFKLDGDRLTVSDKNGNKIEIALSGLALEFARKGSGRNWDDWKNYLMALRIALFGDNAYGSLSLSRTATKSGTARAEVRSESRQATETQLPLFRGTTLAQWEAIKRGETPQSEYSTSGLTWVTFDRESAGAYSRREGPGQAVIIEYKLTVNEKVSRLTDYPGDVRRQGKLSLEDVAKVYDLSGRILYDATSPRSESREELMTVGFLKAVQAVGKAFMDWSIELAKGFAIGAVSLLPTRHGLRAFLTEIIVGVNLMGEAVLAPSKEESQTTAVDPQADLPVTRLDEQSKVKPTQVRVDDLAFLDAGFTNLGRDVQLFHENMVNVAPEAVASFGGYQSSMSEYSKTYKDFFEMLETVKKVADLKSVNPEIRLISQKGQELNDLWERPQGTSVESMKELVDQLVYWTKKSENAGAILEAAQHGETEFMNTASGEILHFLNSYIFSASVGMSVLLEDIKKAESAPEKGVEADVASVWVKPTEDALHLAKLATVVTAPSAERTELFKQYLAATSARAEVREAPIPALGPNEILMKEQALLSNQEVRRKIANNEIGDILSIGDKHGESEDLERVLKAAEDAKQSGKKLHVIIHGDAFDRGKNNKRNWEILKELVKIAKESEKDPNDKEGGNKIKADLLFGNHDVMLIQSMLLNDKRARESWVWQGGKQTLAELGVEGSRDLALWILQNFKLFSIDERNFLHVHGGIPTDKQGNPLITRRDIDEMQTALKNIQSQVKEPEEATKKAEEKEEKSEPKPKITDTQRLEKVKEILNDSTRKGIAAFFASSVDPSEKKAHHLYWIRQEEWLSNFSEEGGVNPLVVLWKRIREMFSPGLSRKVVTPKVDKRKVDRFLEALGVNGLVFAHTHMATMWKLDDGENRIFCVAVQEGTPQKNTSGHLLFNNEGIQFNALDRSPGSFKFVRRDFKKLFKADSLKSKVLSAGWDQRKFDEARALSQVAPRDEKDKVEWLNDVQKEWIKGLNEVLGIWMRHEDYRRIQENPETMGRLDNGIRELLASAVKGDLASSDLERLNRKLLEAIFQELMVWTRSPIDLMASKEEVLFGIDERISRLENDLKQSAAVPVTDKRSEVREDGSIPNVNWEHTAVVTNEEDLRAYPGIAMWKGKIIPSSFTKIQEVLFKNKDGRIETYIAKYVKDKSLEEDHIAPQAQILNELSVLNGGLGVTGICKAKHFVEVTAREAAGGLPASTTKMILFERFPDGASLNDRMNEKDGRSPLAPSDLVEVMSRVIGIVENLHKAGVYHWDIKPGNIWVYKAKGAWQVILFDFDAAFKDFKTASETHRVFKERSLSHTMTERYASRLRYGVATEIEDVELLQDNYERHEAYALAMTLLVMLVSPKRDYKSGIPADVVANKLLEKLDVVFKASKGISGVPIAIKDVLIRAVANGESGYATVAELREAFEKAMHSTNLLKDIFRRFQIWIRERLATSTRQIIFSLVVAGMFMAGNAVQAGQKMLPDKVKGIQRTLVQEKLLDAKDVVGNYGPKTRAAVEMLQKRLRDHGLYNGPKDIVDGTWGSRTAAAYQRFRAQKRSSKSPRAVRFAAEKSQVPSVVKNIATAGPCGAAVSRNALPLPSAIDARIQALVAMGRDRQAIIQKALETESQNKQLTLEQRLQRTSIIAKLLISKLYPDLPGAEQAAMHDLLLFMGAIETTDYVAEIQKNKHGKPILIGVGSFQNELGTLQDALSNYLALLSAHPKSISARNKRRAADSLAYLLGLGDAQGLKKFSTEASAAGPNVLGAAIASAVVGSDSRADILMSLIKMERARIGLPQGMSFASYAAQGLEGFRNFHYGKWGPKEKPSLQRAQDAWNKVSPYLLSSTQFRSEVREEPGTGVAPKSGAIQQSSPDKRAEMRKIDASVEAGQWVVTPELKAWLSEFRQQLAERGDLPEGILMPNTDVAYQMVRNGILPVLDSGTRVLEMGTGSGVVVAMMADATRGIPGLQFVGTDIDPQAVRVSRQMLQGFGNVEIREGDLFEPVMGEKFDVIFWNPPWFSGQWREKTYGVKMVDEHYATVLRFLNDARNYLKPGGRIFMLFPVNYFKDDIQTKISYKFGDPMSSYINGKGLEIGLFEYDPMGSKRSGFSAMPKVSRKVVPVKETPDTMRSEARTASVVPEVRLDINPLVAVAGVDATKVLAFMKIEGSNLDKLKADMTRKGQEGLARERDEFDRREVELEKQFSVAALPKLLVQFFERYGMTEALAAEISSQVVLGGIGTGFVDIRAAGIRGLDAEKIQRTTNAIYDLILKMPGSGVPMIVNNGEDSAFVLKALRKIEIPRLIVLYDQKHPVGRGWNVFPVVSKYKFSERKSANALVGDVIKGSDGKALMAFLTADLDIEQRGILSILADFTNTANPDLKELVCAAAVLINRIYASASPMDQGLMKVNPGMLLAKLKEKGIDLLALSAKSGVLVMSMQTLAQEFAARTEIDKAA